jgi:cytochrome b6-f complex iron-sulfur subunit
MERRELLKKLGRGLLSVLGVSLVGYPIIKFLSHSKENIRSVIFHPSETLLQINYKLGVYLIRKGNAFKAISTRCTHLGCMVAFDERKKEFHCPCHGSVYDIDGKRLSGPAKEPLSSPPFRREKNGDLVIMLKD